MTAEELAGILSNIANRSFHSCGCHNNPTFHLTEFIPAAVSHIKDYSREVERQCAERLESLRPGAVFMGGMDVVALDAAIAAITSPAKEGTP